MRGEIDRNEERRVPRGTIHKDEEREEGCLYGWLAGWNYDGGRFGSFSSRKRPIRISITGRVGAGKGVILD